MVNPRKRIVISSGESMGRFDKANGRNKRITLTILAGEKYVSFMTDGGLGDGREVNGGDVAVGRGVGQRRDAVRRYVHLGRRYELEITKSTNKATD